MRLCRSAVVVDDVPLLAMDVQILCEEQGCKVLALAHSAAQACARFDGLRAEIILTDVDLGPGPDGIEVVKCLRRTCPDVRVVFITADARDSTKRRIAAVRPYRVLSKPLRRAALREALLQNDDRASR